MEFGPRPLDRVGVTRAPGLGVKPGSISAREHRKIGRGSAWAADFESLTSNELEEKYPTGKIAIFSQDPILRLRFTTPAL
jgi:hypothetical protein